ncbi:MAG: FG-GAP repeat protein [Chloroflexi bacterium]|nr:FG-GAP repeat protein [Chloroflexota bacterium]
MRSPLNLLALLASLALLALASACGGGAPTGGPSATPATSPTASPTVTSSPVTVPPASPGGRVTFFGADPGDKAGAIAAGDLDGDGAPDIVLTAAAADGPDNARPDAGEAYVFLGPFSSDQERDPSAGRADFVIYGAHNGDQLGRGLAIGDFNGDGIDDIALGAPFGEGPGPDRPDVGLVYVLFGSSRLGHELRQVDLAAAAPDATIVGADSGDLAGLPLHAADVDGDGRDDLIIGAFFADGPDNDRPDAGEVYVVYGGSLRARLDLRTDRPDAIVYGGEKEDRLGEAVGAGDVNGDGRADLVLAATFADGPNNDRDRAGDVYVILAPLPPVLDAAGGEQDVTIYGIDPGDQAGHSIATGDANGDGYTDLLLGAVSADGPHNEADLAGEAYLVLGAQEPPRTVDLALGEMAATIYGAAAKSRLGRSAAMGDLNGDGLSDLLISAPDVLTEEGPRHRAGAIYILYGRPRGPYAATSAEADITLEGLDSQDILGHEAFGMPPLAAYDVNDDGRADVLLAAPNGDGPGNQRPDSGEAYTIYMEGG